MYWFDIIEVLEDAGGDRLTSFDICVELRKHRSVNVTNVRKTLSKLVHSDSSPVCMDIEVVENQNGSGSHRKHYYYVDP